MNYEERIAVIRTWMKREILTRFTPPTGLDPSIAIDDVVKGVNQNIRSKINPDDMDKLLDKLKDEVLSKSKTRSLPTPAIFQQAAATVAQKLHEAPTGQPQESGTPAYLTSAARRIRAGEPVAEFYVTGNGAEELLDLGLITRANLSGYQH